MKPIVGHLFIRAMLMMKGNEFIEGNVFKLIKRINIQLV